MERPASYSAFWPALALGPCSYPRECEISSAELITIGRNFDITASGIRVSGPRMLRAAKMRPLAAKIGALIAATPSACSLRLMA